MNKDMEFDQYIQMYQSARQLEKSDPDKALDIYFEILYKFTPLGTVYYKRPCILLEKQKRYDEAIEICSRAIEAIENKLFNASSDEFKHRLNRLINKRENTSFKVKQSSKLNKPEEIKSVSELAPKTHVSFPDNYISVSFGKSTSKNFAAALQLAKMSPQYIENTIEDNPVYQGVYDVSIPEQYLQFIQLYELVSNWKSCFVTMNGKLMDRKIIGGLNYCYGDRCRSGSSRFCYGASIATENPFGCHRLQISNFNSPWWGFGYFSSRNIWIVDKESIKDRIKLYSKSYSMCPAFSYDTVFKALEDLPNKIDLTKNKEWVHSYGGIQPRDSTSSNVKVDINGDNNDYNNTFNTGRVTRNTAQKSGCLIPIIILVIFILIII